MSSFESINTTEELHNIPATFDGLNSPEGKIGNRNMIRLGLDPRLTYNYNSMSPVETYNLSKGIVAEVRDNEGGIYVFTFAYYPPLNSSGGTYLPDSFLEYCVKAEKRIPVEYTSDEARVLVRKLLNEQYAWLRDNENISYALNELVTALGYKVEETITKKLKSLIALLLEVDDLNGSLDGLLRSYKHFSDLAFNLNVDEETIETIQAEQRSRSTKRVEPIDVVVPPVAESIPVNTKTQSLSDLVNNLPDKETDLFSIDLVNNMQTLLDMVQLLSSIGLNDVNAIDEFIASQITIGYLRVDGGGEIRANYMLKRRIENLLFKGYMALISDSVERLSVLGLLAPSNKSLLSNIKALLRKAETYLPGDTALAGQTWPEKLARYFDGYAINGVAPSSYSNIFDLITRFEEFRDADYE